MITVTRFDGSNLIVNADLIEFIEAIPDTILTMTTGRKIVVKETPAAVMRSIIAYKQEIAQGPQVTEEG